MYEVLRNKKITTNRNNYTDVDPTRSFLKDVRKDIHII